MRNSKTNKHKDAQQASQAQATIALARLTCQHVNNSKACTVTSHGQLVLITATANTTFKFSQSPGLVFSFHRGRIPKKMAAGIHQFTSANRPLVAFWFPGFGCLFGGLLIGLGLLVFFSPSSCEKQAFTGHSKIERVRSEIKSWPVGQLMTAEAVEGSCFQPLRRQRPLA